MNRIIVSAAAFVVLTCASTTNFAQTRPSPTPIPARPAAAQPTPVPTPPQPTPVTAPRPAAPQPMPMAPPANVPAAKIALVDTSVFGDDDADFEKRYSEVVGPVSNDIGNALIQYAAHNGLTMILDISKLLPAVLSVNPAMDVTQAFIADYNSKHP